MRGSGGTEQSGDVIRLMADDQPGILGPFTKQRRPQNPTRHDAPADKLSRSVRSQLERLMTLSARPGESASVCRCEGEASSHDHSYIVQHAGGWKTASMMQRYAHLDPATIRAAVELLALRDTGASMSASGTDSGTAALEVRRVT